MRYVQKDKCVIIYVCGGVVMFVECGEESLYHVRCIKSLRYVGDTEDTFVAGREYRAYVFYSDVDGCHVLSAIYNDTDDIAISYGEEGPDDERIETLTDTEMFKNNFELI